jgi:hypothetical protein
VAQFTLVTGMEPLEFPALLNERRAARLLGVSVSTLRDSRQRRPRTRLVVPFLKIGRSVRYEPKTLLALLRDSRRTSGGDNRAPAA